MILGWHSAQRNDQPGSCVDGAAVTSASVRLVGFGAEIDSRVACDRRHATETTSNSWRVRHVNKRPIDARGPSKFLIRFSTHDLRTENSIRFVGNRAAAHFTYMRVLK